jgi:hypothetical protein
LLPTIDNGGKPQITEKARSRPQITGKNRFVRFYLPLLWGSRKIGGLTVSVAADSEQFFLQGAGHIQLKSGVDIPAKNQKD